MTPLRLRFTKPPGLYGFGAENILLPVFAAPMSTHASSDLIGVKTYSSFYRHVAIGVVVLAVFTIGGIFALALGLVHVLANSLGPLLPQVRFKIRRLSRNTLGLLLRFFSWLCQRLGLIRLQINLAELQQTPQPCIVVANHPSLLDALWIIPHLSNVICIAKSNLEYSPLWGLWIRILGYICSRDPNRAIDDCVGQLGAGASLLLFPEGTRSPETGLNRFNRGAAIIALRSGRPLVPVLIRYSKPIFVKGRSWFDFPNSPVQIEIIAPVGASQECKPPPLASGITLSSDIREQARQSTELLEDFFARQLNSATGAAR